MIRRLSHIIHITGIIILVSWTTSSVIAQEVMIHGFISQGFMKTDKNNYLAQTDKGSFQFNETGINFSTRVLDDLKVGCQLFARDLGPIGNDKVELNWAFAEYTPKNWIGLRAGLIKGAFGFYNDIRDYDDLRTSIFLPSSVYNEWLRDGINSVKGLDLFGSVGLSFAGRLKYQFQIGETQFLEDSGTVRLIREAAEGADEIGTVYIGTIYLANIKWSSPIDGLMIGTTYIKTDTYWEGTIRLNETTSIPIRYDNSRLEYVCWSIEYISGNLIINAENLWLLSDNDMYVGAYDPINLDNDTKGSYYVGLSYRFLDWLETGGYYSEYVSSEGRENNELISNEKLKDICLSLRFDINPNWIFKLETHMMDGIFGVDEDDDGHTYNKWNLYTAKVSYYF